MTAQPQPEPTLRDVADKLDKLTGDVDKRFDTLSREFERSNDKFDNYQKATQWVFQLAFTLIASATKFIEIMVRSACPRHSANHSFQA